MLCSVEGGGLGAAAGGLLVVPAARGPDPQARGPRVPPCVDGGHALAQAARPGPLWLLPDAEVSVQKNQ